MSDHRGSRVDRDAAERMLDGDPAGGAAGLLAAATAPAHAEELAGERAALAAFVAATRLDPVPRQRRTSMLKIALAKLLTVKAAAAAVAVVGAGGIALAAGTGALPVELPDTAKTPSVVSEAPAQPAGAPEDAGKGGDPAGEPSPSMVGLCQAYLAEVGNAPGRALESPAFTALVDAAGGADSVGGFCQEQIARAKDGNGGPPSGVPAPPAAPEPATSHTPTDRPQPPTTRPTAPTGPPTGGPNG